MDWTTVLVSLGSALLGTIGGWYIALKKLPIEQKSAEIEIDIKKVDLAARIRDVYDEAICDLKSENIELKKRQDEQERLIEILQAESTDLRLENLKLKEQIEKQGGLIEILQAENVDLRRENSELKRQLEVITGA